MPDRQVARFALRDNRTLVFFVFRAESPDLPHDDEECRARIRREFSGAGWETGQMLVALDRADNLYYDVVSQIRMKRWSAERLLLIGDAAACVSLLGGEGVGLAVTEAYLLAGELHRTGGDWRRAFEAWETRLRPFVRGRQKSARRFLSFFTSGKNFGIWFRNQTRRLMHTRPVASLFARHGPRHKFELPDYRM
jgi:2-polyprenyl-6-methoxyphenol hydroxylase-like FAD-dependent oxidoreductase